MAATAAISAMEPIPGVPAADAVSLSGPFGRGEARQLRQQLLASLQATEGDTLVIEMSSVSKMDTSGAAVLAEVIKRAGQRQLKVLLCSPSEAVMNVFELAGFPEVLSQCCADPGETRKRLLA